ncbi:winged helix-turn-helix transcriptional regulator [Microbacterium jejuense]|uniref:Winged helix-turn-helix transcriptional regulator n=1 Tax=Microbacterium jejuense TaxID=1263637 RepID=A0ABS7HR42_9MICO|nr:MarR family winged helix-turn-helix transcriptional regulator [Microbacterium jejuense]MBW9095432.1 winged helix-turn-helix transcriptional regulator [Microbacterium jejuense]
MDAAPRAELLSSLTRLMSRWSSSSVQERIAAGVGVALDPTEIRAVYTLGLHGGTARPGSLADELNITRPTMSKLVARLIADDLVTRGAHPDDGRGATVAFTPRGRDAYRRLVAAGHDMVDHVLAEWTPAEVEAFGGLLHRFVEGLLTESPAPVTPADPAREQHAASARPRATATPSPTEGD